MLRRSADGSGHAANERSILLGRSIKFDGSNITELRVNITHVYYSHHPERPLPRMLVDLGARVRVEQLFLA